MASEKLEKKSDYASSASEKGNILEEIDVVASDMNALGDDVVEAVEYSKTMTDDEVDHMARQVVDVHYGDPNFPPRVLDLARRYVEDPNLKNLPEQWQELKIEMALITIVSLVHLPFENIDSLVIS